MEEKHQIDISPYRGIWEGIKEYHDLEEEKHAKKKTIQKLKRGPLLKFFTPPLEQLRDETRDKFDKIYTKQEIKKKTQ